jgi:hypothetical protein
MSSSQRVSSRPLLRGIAAAAEYLGLSERLVRRHREYGIPSIRVGKRVLLFDPDQLDSWIQSRNSAQ